jgi:malonyl-CoA/methylmalonyl-CoA synthetase
MNANLYTLLSSHFPEDREQPCLIFTDRPVIAYSELDAASARFAHALIAAGARRGDRVAVQVDKCWEALALYLACLRSGLVFLPLNTGYQKSELAYLFGDAEPSIIVCRPESAERVGPLRPEAATLTLASGTGTLLERVSNQASAFETALSAPDDVAAILYTSGTTGRPKGAMLTHRNLASNALTLVDYWGFTRGDVLLHALPVYHVHGLFVACHCALLSGARMLWLPKFDGDEVCRLLPRATVMMGVPTFYTRLLAQPNFGADHCRSVRLFISGSAPLLPETFEDFRQRTGQTILERYGMTETGMNASNPLVGERIAGTVGPPLPGISIRIADGEGRACAAGEVGGIEVSGHNVFAGYWRMPDKTRDEFTADGYFRTGDVGELLPNGYLRIVGRAKDLIISGGLNVYPKEIEERIDALSGVVESAVIGVPDPDFGEAVVAIVVGSPGQVLNESSVIAALKGEIASFKIPKRVHFVADLPRNAMGKVQKNVLREKFAPPTRGTDRE